MTSPERDQRKEVFRLLKPGGPRAGFGIPQARGFVGLMILGIVIGIPMAVGLIPGSVFAMVGALAACMVGRFLLAGRAVGMAPMWLVALGWSMVAAAVRFGTLDIRGAQAAQSALGPGPLVGPEVAAVVSGAAGLAGLIAAVFWVESLPRIEAPEGQTEAVSLDVAARWGQTAAAASAVASLAWGPSFGGLVFGPIEQSSLRRTAISVGVVLVSVAVASWSRRIAARIRGRIIFGLVALLSTASAAAAVWLLR